MKTLINKIRRPKTYAVVGLDGTIYNTGTKEQCHEIISWLIEYSEAGTIYHIKRHP